MLGDPDLAAGPFESLLRTALLSFIATLQDRLSSPAPFAIVGRECGGVANELLGLFAV